MADVEANSDFDPDEDFYEDDEPLEKVLAAYKHGLKGVTARPVSLDLTAPPYYYLPEPSTRAWPASVSCRPATPEPIHVPAARAA
ncbi:MAG TPA: hypothetical protein VKD26_11420 [Streptosporangiaceae bacterium]|nr:hypothetical protein [Streptosporangiaceae bacterium]